MKGDWLMLCDIGYNNATIHVASHEFLLLPIVSLGIKFYKI